MKRKILWAVLSCLMVVALVLASCTSAPEVEEEKTVEGEVVEKETPAVEEEEEEEVAKGPEMILNAWGELQEKPRYGGTITLQADSGPVNGFDPYDYGGNQAYEELGHGNWIIDREICDFMTFWWPEEMGTGCLAESWEEPDPETLIFYIRKGVRWQNKPPVNGREFTAYDVEYTFHRNWGLGSGFTEKSPKLGYADYETITSVTATDKYTVVFKHKPTLELLHSFLTQGVSDEIIPREVVEMYGDLRDWKNIVGTGPWIMNDYVSDSSLTFIKNPDYWGVDEMFPGYNFKLPYADKYMYLIIPDLQTTITAIRTGKIDKYGGGWTTLSLEQVNSLKKTNPDIQVAYSTTQGTTVALRFGKKPFDDIRVRRALQKSIDLETIARTYYQGAVAPIPKPLLANPGFFTPMDQLPAEVQEGYKYDPEAAKQLLTEAGYPNGFETNLVITPGNEDLATLVKGYFSKINVDVEIITKDPVTYAGIMYAGNLDQMTLFPAMLVAQPVGALGWYTSDKFYNVPRINDPHYDDLFNQIVAMMDKTEWKKLLIELNDYGFSQQWVVSLLPLPGGIVWQPWLKSYRGERILANASGGGVFARVWVDQELKNTMVR